jgi:hypothetical protein
MMLATSKKLSKIPQTNVTGLIKKPVTAKKIGMNSDLPRNSSLALAGLPRADALTASPARNAPTMPGNWIASASTPAMAHNAQHQNEVGVFLIFDAREHVCAEAAKAEQHEHDIAYDLGQKERQTRWRKSSRIDRHANREHYERQSVGHHRSSDRHCHWFQATKAKPVY